MIGKNIYKLFKDWSDQNNSDNEKIKKKYLLNNIVAIDYFKTFLQIFYVINSY